MKKISKRMKSLYPKVDKLKFYDPEEAFKVLIETKSAKFIESVDVAFRLGVDPRHSDQQIRGTVILPHGTGKKIKILVITQSENIEKALKAGATYAGSEEYIEKIKAGWFDFDIVIATPDMMPKIGKLGKILGTKGLMPNPKSGTVTSDVEKTVQEFSKGKLAFRIDKFGSIHMLIGKIDFEYDKLLENFKMVVETIVKLKPDSAKGVYLKSLAVATTMGPGIRIDTILAQKFALKNNTK